MHVEYRSILNTRYIGHQARTVINDKLGKKISVKIKNK